MKGKRYTTEDKIRVLRAGKMNQSIQGAIGGDLKHGAVIYYCPHSKRCHKNTRPQPAPSRHGDLHHWCCRMKTGCSGFPTETFEIRCCHLRNPRNRWFHRGCHHGPAATPRWDIRRNPALDRTPDNHLISPDSIAVTINTSTNDGNAQPPAINS
jgi:hypothetical protein